MGFEKLSMPRKRSNRARSFLPTTSIIKKDADSDFNHYHHLLTIFSLLSFFSKFASSLPNYETDYIFIQGKIAKLQRKICYVKKNNWKFHRRIFCSKSIFASCTKMVSMRCNYSSRGQLAASGAKNLNSPSSVALNCCGRLAPVLHPSSRHPKIYLRPRGPARIRYEAGQAEKIISPRKLKLLWEPSQQREAIRINVWPRMFWRVYILQ